MDKKNTKMAIFSPKMVQMTWNFDITCIWVVFIDFQNFGNFRPKLPDFRVKNLFFFADSAKI